MKWNPPEIAKGQVWIDTASNVIFRVTNVTDDTIYYLLESYEGVLPTSRIQWEVDAMSGRLALTEPPDTALVQVKK